MIMGKNDKLVRDTVAGIFLDGGAVGVAGHAFAADGDHANEEKCASIIMINLCSVYRTKQGGLAQAYGHESMPVRSERGGLAPWQLKRAKHIMSENLDSAIQVDELAEACRLSVSHFARAFKVTTGQSPHRWLLGYRVERAKRLLLESKLPLTNVALACGFADQSHFARVFSRIAGAAPGAWRRAVRSPTDAALALA
jgi:transcriptional regulator GlxA family with amidase domain